MQILKGRVDWMEGRENRPNLYLLVDEIPALDELRFDVHDNGGTIEGGYYFAELGGYCRFFSYHGHGNNGGFGGDKFEITMRDGTKRTLHGPWSSNSATMNEYEFGPCTEALLTTDVNIYINRGPWHVGAVLVSLLREYRDRIHLGPGYTWRPGARYAAEVAFPEGSKLAVACAGHTTVYTRDDRQNRFVAMPETFPDGVRIENVRSAIRAALALDNLRAQPAPCPQHGVDYDHENGCIHCIVRMNRKRASGHDTAYEIANRYRRFLPSHCGEPLELLLSLTAYEPAVQFPDGEIWVKPVS